MLSAEFLHYVALEKKTSNVPVFKLQSAETIINVLLRVNYWYIKIGREWNARTEAWIPWLMICWFLGLEKARTWSEIRPFLEVVNGAIQLFVTLPRQIQPYWCSLDRTQQQVESEMNSNATTTSKQRKHTYRYTEWSNTANDTQLLHTVTDNALVCCCNKPTHPSDRPNNKFQFVQTTAAREILLTDRQKGKIKTATLYVYNCIT